MKKMTSFLASFALVSSLAVICFASPDGPPAPDPRAPVEGVEQLKEITNRRECKEACRIDQCTGCWWNNDTKICTAKNCAN